jgi:hypothetical protein
MINQQLPRPFDIRSLFLDSLVGVKTIKIGNTICCIKPRSEARTSGIFANNFSVYENENIA